MLNNPPKTLGGAKYENKNIRQLRAIKSEEKIEAISLFFIPLERSLFANKYCMELSPVKPTIVAAIMHVTKLI